MPSEEPRPVLWEWTISWQQPGLKNAFEQLEERLKLFEELGEQSKDDELAHDLMVLCLL